MRTKLLLAVATIMVMWSCQKESMNLHQMKTERMLPDWFSHVQSDNTLRDEIEMIDSTYWLSSTGDTALIGYNYLEDADTLFVIINAEEMMYPVAAYGKGAISREAVSPAISVFIEYQIDEVEHVRQNYSSRSKYLEERLGAIIEDPDEPCEGTTLLAEKGPLLQSEWGQGCYYNDHLGGSCSWYCGKYLTGCVATAMAQIMNFHRWPGLYNWQLMLPKYTRWPAPTKEQIDAVALLMKHAGRSVKMNWGCNSSGAYSCREVPDALKYIFSYTSADNCFRSLNFNKIKKNIFSARPVLLRGCSEEFGGCHAWVCDGIREYEICEIKDLTGEQLRWIMGYYSMNWGWDGRYNGWFSSSTSLFSESTAYIGNIKP